MKKALSLLLVLIMILSSVYVLSAAEDSALTTEEISEVNTEANPDEADVITAAEESAGEEPVGEEPTGEEPAGEEPAGEEPAGEEPAGEEPVGEEPVGEEPAGEEPAGEEPAGEEPAEEEPVKEEPVKEEPVKEEPVKEEPVKEEPVKEEPVKEEPVKEEPVKEEPVKEEPVKEEPVKEEPVKEEPVKEEPVKEEPSRFEEGYVLLKKDTVLYCETKKTTEIGSFTGNSYAYAVLEKEGSESGKDWLRLTFDTEAARNGGQDLLHGYVQYEQVSALSAEETGKLEAKLAQDTAAREFRNHKLPLAEYRAKDEAAEETAAEEAGEELEPNLLPSVSVSPKTVYVKGNYATATFTAKAKNTSGTIKYQWQYKNTGSTTWYNCVESDSFKGTTKKTLTVSVDNTNRKYTYRCRIIVNGMEIYSSGASIISFIIEPVCQGASVGDWVHIDAHAEGPDIDTQKYQWQASTDAGKTWKDISWGTDGRITFEVNKGNMNRLYRCKITVNGVTKATNPAYLLCAVLPNTVYAEEGKKASLTVSCENAMGDVTYTWKRWNGSDWVYVFSDVKGANQYTWKIPAEQAFYNNYQCIVTDATGKSSTSNFVYVLPSPSVTVSPVVAKALIGESFILTATAHYVDNGGETYQWQYSADKGKTWSNYTGTGNKTNQVTISVKRSTVEYRYRCKMKYEGKTAYTKEAALFSARAKASVDRSDIGKSMYFKADVWHSGGNRTYLWECTADGGKTWTTCPSGSDYSGRKSEKLIVKVRTYNANYQYRCRVSGSYGEIVTNVAYATPNKRYLAVLVANDDYWYANDLPGCAQDGTTMQKALKAYGWKVKLVRNASAYDMEYAIYEQFGDTISSDVCLFYYSGHGYTDSGTYAGALAGVDGSAFTASDLRDALLNTAKGQVTVLLDSCGSGAMVYSKGAGGQAGDPRNFTNGVMNAFSGYLMNDSEFESNTGELLQKRFAVLAACENGKTSADGYYVEKGGKVIIKRGGTFTYSLVRAMGCSYPSGSMGSSLLGDSSGDNKLSLSEAYSYIKAKVKSMNKLITSQKLYKYIDGEAYYYCYDEDGTLTAGAGRDQVVQKGGSSSAVLFKRK